MSQAERKNSCISLEFEIPDSEAVLLGCEVERLWNGGQFDAALAQLASLESRVGHVAIGNSWRTPVPTFEAGLWGRDVRIGNRDSLLELSLASQASSGNLFVVLRHGSGPPDWSVCMSADSGATWDETYNWSGSPQASLDAAVAVQHLYVVYSFPGQNAQEVRVRPLLCSNGRADGDWVTRCTLDVGDTMREVSLVSNQNNNELYLVTLVSDGSVLVSFGDANAVSWTRLSTGISSCAYGGLDATDDGRSDTTCFFFSYYDMNDSLRIWGSAGQRFSVLTGRGTPTSISACGGTVICAYEDETASPHQVRYAANFGGGDTWIAGTLSSADTASDSPGGVTREGKLAVVFRHCAPASELRFRERTTGGTWSDPVSIADHEPHGSRPGIAYLGSGGYGVAYLSDTIPVVRGAYFDRSDWVYGIAEWGWLVGEQGVLDVTPNPLKGRGRVNCTLYRPAVLRVQMYDRAGRFVRTLLKGRRLAGGQSVSLDAADLTPGVYFIRAAADDRSLTVPVTIVR
jgi:hypothetical protein